MLSALTITIVRVFPFVLLLLSVFSAFGQRNASWEEAQQTKKGTITVYWFRNKPFSYEENGKVTGVEVEVMSAFVRYLKKQYNIALDINWIEKPTFKEVIDHMRNDSLSGTFGAASFTISNERRKFMKFSTPYMPDVMVLVSTSDIPIVQKPEDMARYFNGATAFAAEGTLNERELIALRAENNLNFEIRYAGGSEEMMDSLKARKKSFCYLNLPAYLMSIGDNTDNLQRHNYLTKRFEGRAIGMPTASDWDLPLKEFFADSQSVSQIEGLIGRFISPELLHFVETLSPENEVSLLNQERFLQTKRLSEQKKELKDKGEKMIFLGATAVTVSLLLVVIAVLYRGQKKSRLILLAQHQRLVEMNTTIEHQSEEVRAQNEELVAQQERLAEQNAIIESQNKQLSDHTQNLERLVAERTSELESANSELAYRYGQISEFAFMTAHNLRGPVSRMIGLHNLVQLQQAAPKEIINMMGATAHDIDQVLTDINAVLNISKRQHTTREHFDLAELLDEVLEGNNTYARDPKPTVKISLQVRSLYGERETLRTVLAQIIGNSIKFSRPEQQLTINISATSIDQTVYITVGDNGLGMDMQFFKDKIFKLYQRYHTHQAGRGFGLYLCRILVENAGGKISASSEIGVGTIIEVSLPSQWIDPGGDLS